ncbi:signal peptidase I [Periweissella cryptocerci]|uniref:Signal peptidase I n=1 Tax=Periweissella cryptocerci TaxID=2506420 RepID=A0A4P6YU42_9LACO|nr:signal peptidase I [Periweissella cryptocerci]QBO36294.1 signal peptidase I [Periweissella cryptocerci]
MKIIKGILSWVLPVLIGLAIAMLIRHFLFTLVRVDGTSMTPNLQNNERVWVVKPASIHRGSVIVFNADGEDPAVTGTKDYVKRVIGMPGDTVSNKDGVLLVNGKQVDENFISKSEATAGTANWDNLEMLGIKQRWQDTPSVKVPKDQYFVLGDHRSVSNDSRYWGFVQKKKILGVVKVPFWLKNPAKDNINKQWENFYSTEKK